MDTPSTYLKDSSNKRLKELDGEDGYIRAMLEVTSYGMYWRQIAMEKYLKDLGDAFRHDDSYVINVDGMIDDVRARLKMLQTESRDLLAKTEALKFRRDEIREARAALERQLAAGWATTTGDSTGDKKDS